MTDNVIELHNKDKMSVEEVLETTKRASIKELMVMYICPCGCDNVIMKSSGVKNRDALWFFETGKAFCLGLDDITIGCGKDIDDAKSE